MKLKQRTYVAIYSKDTPLAVLEDALGLQPDMRRKRRPNRSLANRSLEFHVRDPAAPLDTQIEALIEALIERLRPAVPRIKAAIETMGAHVGFQVVREFDTPDGEPESHEPIVHQGQTLTAMSGQHQLLGFHLEASTIAFLADLGASIDFDEYG